MSRRRSPLRRAAIASLQRAGRLDQYFDARRGWRRKAATVRGRYESAALRRRLGGGVTNVVAIGGRAAVADAIPRYVAHERMVEHLDSVTQALTAHGIEHAICPIPTAQQYRVVVDDGVRPLVWTALRSLATRPSAYVWFAGAPPRSLRPLCTFGDDLPPVAARSAVWSYFRAVCDGGASRVLATQHACQVEFWRRAPATAGGDDESGTSTDDAPGLRARRPNMATDELTAAARVPAEVAIGPKRYPSWQPFAQIFASDRQRFPVDVVYTWVDDNDPDWVARRQECLGIDHLVSADGVAAMRFANRDELRYSLRSLDTFGEFVRHVYIVTDRQRPGWLIERDDLTVIDHTDIFDTDAALPTFNSHAIESRLHHIDGLSEHYVYMNDDVFFGRRVTANVFFAPSGTSRFFPSKARVAAGPPAADEPSVTSAAKNGRDLLFGSHGYAPTHKMKHTPHAQRLSTFQAMELTYPDEFKQLQQHRFRTPHDISMAASLHHHYGYITGTAAPGTISYQYVNLAADNLPDRLDDLVSGRWDTFCLNDADVPPERAVAVNALVAEWLPRAFPFPSRFERSDY